MAQLSVPTSGQLPPSLRINNASSIVQKTISRVSRLGLLGLALGWLDDEIRFICPPVLAHEYDPSDFHPPAESVDALRQLYRDMRERKGSKREVIDRILEGDWRDGLSLYQLAMADMRYLHEHPSSQRWSAYRIMPLVASENDDHDISDKEEDLFAKRSVDILRFHPSTFLQKLENQVLPDMKVHYHIDRPAELAMLIVRVFLVDSPYTTIPTFATRSSGEPTQVDVSRTLYIAFPDGSPYVYLSRPQTVGTTGGLDAKAIQNLVARGIPKALSQPHRRYTLKYADMSTKNMSVLLFSKANTRTSGSGGSWSIYADNEKVESPLDATLPPRPFSEEESTRASSTATSSKADGSFHNKRKCIAQARFGKLAKMGDGQGIERLDVRMEDPFGGPGTMAHSDDGGWSPSVKMVAHGSHIHAGIRQLVEAGIIGGRRMPGWLSGEEGVTIGAVKEGRIRGHKGLWF